MHCCPLTTHGLPAPDMFLWNVSRCCFATRFSAPSLQHAARENCAAYSRAIGAAILNIARILVDDKSTKDKVGNVRCRVKTFWYNHMFSRISINCQLRRFSA